ncbi:MAG: 3-deoxy-D-manno-octulosonate 8-phosphate phosphatase [Bacteroidales bacterium]|nr:3-deoxy-D-manno-octulosonate 8-phosphate phosphatase [Bacteroidales bacterium]
MSAIDYPLSKIKAIAFDVDGVLSPAVVSLDDNGIPRRMANLRDGYAMVVAIKAGLRLAIISGGKSDALYNRFKIIGIDDIFLGIGDKLPVLRQWMLDNGLTPEEVAFVGDDVPDVAPMLAVGLPVTPADASVDTKAVARYITSAEGGRGVARELIEEILRDRGSWPGQSVSLGQ